MVGYRPSGIAPRMSAEATTPASLAAWERAQRRREEIEDAAWEQRRLADRDAAAAAQLRAAAATANSPRSTTGQPPQLHYHLPGSQAADAPADLSTPRHSFFCPAPSPPVDAPGAASAAVGIPVANHVDNRGQPPFQGPAAPLPAGEVQHGSQTVWNLVGSLRQPGDGGVPHALQPTPLGPNRSVHFGTHVNIPSLQSSSAPRAEPMSAPWAPALPSASPVAGGASSTPVGPPLGLSSAGNVLNWTPPSAAAAAVAEPWSAAQVSDGPWTPAVRAAAPSSTVASETEKAAAEAAAAAVEAAATPPTASLSGPFPPCRAPSRPRAAAQARGANKRRHGKTPSVVSTAPPTKKTKTTKEADGATCNEDGSAAPDCPGARTPEAVAAWVLVKGEVAKVVRDSNKALWSALKQSTEQIEHLKANTNRLEARVDAQGQGHERTAMAVASVRLAVKNLGATGGSKRSGSGSGGGGGDIESKAPVKDEKPMFDRVSTKAAAMALAPENEVNAAKLRRPVREAVKRLVANTIVSRDVLMDTAVATARISDEAMKVFGMTPGAAHSYLMDFIYFPSATKNAAPTLKRPHTVVVATISHAMAQLREFVLKPYFKVLGFEYNPMSRSKAKKWYKDDSFLTSYKGQKAVVAAAKNLFTKIGGSSRIIKDTSAGGRFHVDMTVGHYSLIGSFVRNEFEIALGHRQRRRKGNGSGTYCYWVDEFAHSIKHLSKNHKDNNIHGGYRITDSIDPDIVVRTATGGWVFTAPGALSPVPADNAVTGNLAMSADRPRATNRTDAASRRPSTLSSLPPSGRARHTSASAGDGVTRRPATKSASPVATRNCRDDYGVGADDDGRASDGISNPPATGVVLVLDDDEDHCAGAAIIGLKEDGAGSDVGGSDVGGSDGVGSDGDGSDGDGSENVGGRTSTSASVNSDTDDDDGGSSVLGDEGDADDDEEEG